MDEPMEAEADSTQPDLAPEEESPKKQHPLLRPGSMVMMTITNEDYQTQYWPKLEGAIDQLLTMTPGQYIPISYEQMYSCVYKCVCKQFSEKLYADLMSHMIQHLEKLNEQLKTLVSKQIKINEQVKTLMQVEEPKSFIEKFSFLLNQYLQALGGIVPIFNYMNRFYVETKLKTDLNEELRKLFRHHILDQHIDIILSLLEDANSTPFLIPPQTMASTVKNVYSINPEYAKVKPTLFAKYLPSVLPQTNVHDLDTYIAETKQMQEDMKMMEGFSNRYIIRHYSAKRPN
ncbi:hypothetical protein FSP39_011168 [Pinctada imbricata]|uniref:Cullin N-terminal domain-containing protein n=1 Tax=Pinctada imbricata TaxID=66713 RepID=A0AA88Y046_PINIB|nr:hypothetical protein FSP39_011168 [Pinctada imbricata]